MRPAPEAEARLDIDRMLVAAGWLPSLAALAVALLAVRAGWGLSTVRRRSTPRAIGFTEIAWGVATVLLVAAGFWTGT